VESTSDPLERDTIDGFEHGIDTIDLSAIDAIPGKGDNAFTFITGAFTGHAGELHVTTSGGGFLVEGDTNGDAVADFAILVRGSTAPTAADFVL
jgi:serralysin